MPIATLLGATCCVRNVACVWPLCCDMLGFVGSNLTSFKLEPTTSNMSQHIATRWPNARNMLHPTMLRCVVLACWDRLAGALCLPVGHRVVTFTALQLVQFYIHFAREVQGSGDDLLFQFQLSPSTILYMYVGWVCCWFLPCSKGFSPVLWFFCFSLSTKTNISNFQLPVPERIWLPP